MAQKYSRQREVIRAFLKGRTDHPSADMVYSAVRQEIPNISLGTVYRNLMLLAETGELTKVDVGDGVVRFDPFVEDHCHFICSHCGRVLDVMVDDDEMFTKAAKKALPGARVNGHSITFRGLCPKCAVRDRVAV